MTDAENAEQERAALSDAQQRVYDITRNQIMRGPAVTERHAHDKAMQAATNEKILADYARGRAKLEQQRADDQQAAFRRSKSVSAMRKIAEAQQSAASAAVGNAKLLNVPDSDLISSLQALCNGPEFSGKQTVVTELESEIQRRGLKVA